MTRREMLVGLGGILATGTCPAVLNNVPLCRVGKFAPSNPYVTDGLIAMWDGEWNAGWGVHDANATMWSNLADETKPLSIPNIVFGDNYAILSNSTGMFDGIDFVSLWNNGISVEIATSLDGPTGSGASAQAYIVRLSGNNQALYLSIDIGMAWTQTLSTYGFATARFRLGSSGSVSFDKTQPKMMMTTLSMTSLQKSIQYLNGEMFKTSQAATSVDYAPITNNLIFGGGTGWASGNLKINCFRFYSKELTAAEVAANYAVDKSRFNI